MKSKFLTKLKYCNEIPQAQGKTCIADFFVKCDFILIHNYHKLKKRLYDNAQMHGNIDI